MQNDPKERERMDKNKTFLFKSFLNCQLKELCHFGIQNNSVNWLPPIHPAASFEN